MTKHHQNNRRIADPMASGLTWPVIMTSRCGLHNGGSPSTDAMASPDWPGTGAVTADIHTACHPSSLECPLITSADLDG
jgi:hypothetical protein